MEIPGPFETVATEAYYNMTLPDAKLSAKDTREFMKQWYFAAISNVSVHEVWPGHYLQFLYGKTFPSDIRRVLGVLTAEVPRHVHRSRAAAAAAHPPGDARRQRTALLSHGQRTTF